MPITTASKDTLSDGTTPVSFGQLREYYGITGAVSLSGSLNNTNQTVPDTLPGEETTISVSDFRTKNRILVKMGITDTITSDAIGWAPRQSSAVQFHVYTIGGGASGGVGTGDGGQEKGGSGGGAGGVAFKQYTSEELASANIVIGAGGNAVSVVGAGRQKTGYDGETTTFISYSPKNTVTYLVSGGGGQRGRGGRQGIGSAPGNTATTNGMWGFAKGATAIGGLGGDKNYYSGGSPTVYAYAASAFTMDGVSYPADTSNRDQSAVSSGGSVNLGLGVVGNAYVSDTNNAFADFQGLEAENGAASIAPQPLLPEEWENHVIASGSLCTFTGGTAIGETSGGNGPAGGSGSLIGGGGGGGSAQSGTAVSGAGSNGGVIVTYYGLPNATVVDYDLPTLSSVPVQLPLLEYNVYAFSGTLSGTSTAQMQITAGGEVKFQVAGTQGGGTTPDDFDWLLIGNAVDYEVRFSHVESINGGNMQDDAGTGWLNLGTTRTWTVFDDGNSGEPSMTSGTLSIRNATSQIVLASTEVLLSALQSP